MRVIILIITGGLLSILFSCADKKEEPAPPREVSKDTSVTIPPIQISNPYATVDQSPMDMSYYPEDYPKLKMANKNLRPPYARVIYSRPQLQGRHLFDNLLQFGERWRLGANEATEIQLYQDASIQGKAVKQGRYILYCIPQQDKWTIIFNSNIDSWGLEQSADKDVYRFEVPAEHNHASIPIEFFTMVFEKSGTTESADLVMTWGDWMARLPIRF